LPTATEKEDVVAIKIFSPPGPQDNKILNTENFVPCSHKRRRMSSSAALPSASRGLLFKSLLIIFYYRNKLILFPSLLRPHNACSPPSPLFNGYLVLFPELTLPVF